MGDDATDDAKIIHIHDRNRFKDEPSDRLLILYAAKLSTSTIDHWLTLELYYRHVYAQTNQATYTPEGRD